MIRTTAEGSPEPLGVTPRDGGVNVAVFSANADRIEFCLFDADGLSEVARLPLRFRSGDIHHAFFSDIPPGSRYGLRAHGPYAPSRGHRFNPHKLLVDPFATALDRRFELHASMFGHTEPDGSGFSKTDSAPHVPKAIVNNGSSEILAGKRPSVAWPDAIVYELNLRAFSMCNPAVPELQRGTFAGLGHPASIRHLKELGVTTVEIMPAAAWIDERHLPPLGLSNAWGYNPVALLAPEPRLAPGGWTNIKDTVEALHDAGIEVILDVVLNHTGEGDALGPTLSFRGLDNASYYRLRPDDPSRYIDDMGCGNCLALDRPHAVRLCMDALRTWAATGIDGFRFDLATALGRRPAGFDPGAPLIAAIRQDPALRHLKLIAEAWDIGPGGYQVGRFSADFAEWNDRYRDDARQFWRGDRGAHRAMATRLAGSQDLFAGKRRPARSINFVTAHDGFTLADLVSHEHKHNAANGEEGRDGTNANHSWNNGCEGATTDADIQARRRRDQANLLATLLLSRGTPMLSMGAEIGHSQQGNNNAYAQDNAITWLDWRGADKDLFKVARALISARRATPAVCEDRFLTGTTKEGSDAPDARWLSSGGQPMTDADWLDDAGLLLALECRPDDAAARDHAVIVLHRGSEDATFVLPAPEPGHHWLRRVDTATDPDCWNTPEPAPAVGISARSVTLFVTASDAAGRTAQRGPDDALIARLADAAGVYRDWWDHGGQNHAVGIETKRALLQAMGLDVSSAAACRDALRHLAALRAVEPPPAQPCWLPDAIDPCFGLATQLYALRRDGDQGIGDFSTLRTAATLAAAHGARSFGINPLHALFADEPERASPYHPSDRRFLDERYIDLQAVAALPGGAAVAGLLGDNADLIATARDARLIGHDFAVRFKRRALSHYFAGYAQSPEGRPDAALAAEFEQFITAAGPGLQRFATFRAIQAAHPGIPWQSWPSDLSNVHSTSVTAYAREQADAVRFECFLQWLAERQLGEAATAAREAGLAHGLYRDLAVGCAPDGAEIWADSENYASGVSIGAPPDPFSADGQVWNLPPPNPIAMLADAGASFRTLIAANMRHAGMLRIDHVMGLSRLFWVPAGAGPNEGAYVAYPFERLLGVLAEESHRAKCMVVGEDLGTVPDGLRERLGECNVLSYRVLWFEQDDSGFKAPSSYPQKAAACVSTHDLSTLAGWWDAVDLAEKARLGLLPDPPAAHAERDRQKEALAALLRAEGVPADATRPLTDRLAADIHHLIAGTPSLFAFAQLDDMAGEPDAVNLPGTDRERPNWRRRLQPGIERLFSDGRAAAVLGAMARRR